MARTIAWLLLVAFVALAVALTFWIGLGVVMLGLAPIGKALVVLAIVLVLAGTSYWLVARAPTTEPVVRSVVLLLVVVLAFAGAVWALTARDQALFLAREVTWGDSDVLDYEKFPARAIANEAPGPAAELAQGSTDRLGTIEYRVDGRPEQTGLDDFLDATHTTSFVVVQHDKVVYEHYANGYGRDSVVTSFSIAKSVTSALVGIAIDEGRIDSVDDLVVDYLPEMRGRGLDTVTIKDLLLMSTGIGIVHQDDKSAVEQLWPFQDEALSYYHPDLRGVALGLAPSPEPPGAAFHYNQYHPLLLGMILERTTHEPVSEYLQDKLWGPLGMEYPASWSLDSERDGFEKMESGINGAAVDFARFGMLFLHNGAWNGQQVVSAGWVAESTAPDPDDTRPFLSEPRWKDAGGYYRYMWWGMRTADGGYYYVARGHLGQRVAVFPGDDVVIVRFGLDDKGVDSWDDVIAAVAAKLR